MSCMGQQTVTDTALPVISPGGGGGGLLRLLDDGRADLASGDRQDEATLGLRAEEAAQAPAEEPESCSQVLRPRAR